MAATDARSRFANHYLLRVAYDGSRFHGFQIQPNAWTVQAEMERTLRLLVGSDYTFVGACRTDTGVHAVGQAVVVRFDRTFPPDRFLRACNHRMSPHVRIRTVEPRPPGFHPRFDAIQRRYRFVLREGPASAHEHAYVSHVRGPVDWDLLEEVASKFLGDHDYVSFCTLPSEERRTARSMDHMGLHRLGPYRILDLHAPSFLRGMVRNITGWLLAVAEGRFPPTILDELLAAREKTHSVKPAPPHGLYLHRVLYPGDDSAALDPPSLPFLDSSPLQS